MQFDWFAIFAHFDVQEFHKKREKNRKIQIAFWNYTNFCITAKFKMCQM